MTQNNNNIWEEEQVLASDLWSVAKSLTPMSSEEELEAWRKTVKVLDNLCGTADGLVLEPLILALADAKTRSEEELERVQDRLSRPEGENLHPRGSRIPLPTELKVTRITLARLCSVRQMRYSV